MQLGEVFKNINKNYKKIQFRNVRFNSKDCKLNDIFFAIKGNNSEGKHYIKDAIKNGARIIVSNLNFSGFSNKKILYIHDKNPRKLLSDVSSKIYKLKPKNIIAITGTNGKTSVANFYQQILNFNNKKVASIGTLGVLSKKIRIKTNNTSIDPISIHRILQKIKKLKIDNVILEASSHGLKQYRLNNIKFKTALFTNLSRDHLDYHKTMKNYLNSKLYLFDKLLNPKGNIIFDEKIKQTGKLNIISKKRNLKKYTFGNSKSFIKIVNIKKINEHNKVDFVMNKKNYSFKTSLIGRIQIKNLMFAIIAAYLSNLKINKIVRSIHKIKPIEGRFEKIGYLKNNASVILDYAHTPNALETAILNLKEEFPLSKISLVFGCGGNRDKDKRSIMGSIAKKYCANIYLTDDNPRSENPKLIRDQIKKGLHNKKIYEIPSRSKAIIYAINRLSSGDVLIVAGKGHENYQAYKKIKFFSDKLEILKAISMKNNHLSKYIKTNILKEELDEQTVNKHKTINSVSINSKAVNKNSIFIGIKGKKFNGSKFSNEAIKRGAVLAISNKNNSDSKIVFKKNPLQFLNKLGEIYRKTLNPNTIAITGSAGKTSVKELIGFCLNKLEKTYFSKNSYNNKFGVPLSIFNAPEKTKFLVLEAGMDKKGEIDYLTKLIKPNIGLITNISYAHIKNFKNLNQIARCKGEIINNILKSGTMIINMDDNYFKYFIKKSKKFNLNIITYSKKKYNADIIFLSQIKKKNNFLFKVKINETIKKFLIPKQLSDYKENILACLSVVANYFELDKLKENLFLGFRIPKSRGSLISYKKSSKKLIIIDESYNSNPLSLKFALQRFSTIKKRRDKKFLLIGDMLELGKHSKKLHIKIAKYINNTKVNKTHIYGKYIKHTFNKLKPQIKGKILNNKMDIYNLINKELPNNSLLMVKGSNSTGLNKIIKKL